MRPSPPSCVRPSAETLKRFKRSSPPIHPSVFLTRPTSGAPDGRSSASASSSITSIRPSRISSPQTICSTLSTSCSASIPALTRPRSPPALARAPPPSPTASIAPTPVHSRRRGQRNRPHPSRLSRAQGLRFSLAANGVRPRRRLIQLHVPHSRCRPGPQRPQPELSTARAATGQPTAPRTVTKVPLRGFPGSHLWEPGKRNHPRKQIEGFVIGGPGRIRTYNQRIMSPLL